MTDLCPEAETRRNMDDGEFWNHVASNLGLAQEDVEDLPYEVLEEAVRTYPCEVCGSDGACAYDAEGRALIHPDGGDE